MEVECLLLDLDDTLYSERTYFESEVTAVIEWLAAYHVQDVKEVHVKIFADLQENGRSNLFDRIPVPPGIRQDIWKKTLLHIYRTHTPQIQLFPEAAKFLELCKAQHLKLGLVTDGRSRVQWRKIEALGLQNWLDLILCTEDIDTNKPETKPFEIVMIRLNLKANQCIYIADDASKDFLAPLKLGMKTVQIKHVLEFSLSAGNKFIQGADYIVEIIALLARQI